LANHSRLQATHLSSEKAILAIRDSLTKTFKARLGELYGKDQLTFVSFYMVKRHNKTSEKRLHKRLAAKLLYWSYSSISGGIGKDYVYDSRPGSIESIMKLRHTLKIQDDDEATALRNMMDSEQ
jgi:hypothetical protein